MQRLRLRFSRGEELKYISHLDIIRLWHRAFRRAGMEPAYSAGFSPHPRIFLAAPLPLGVTGEAELADVVFEHAHSPALVANRVNAFLPAGIRVDEAMQVPAQAPSLQASVTRAEYRVTVPADFTLEQVKSSIEEFLALKELPWSHQRQEKTVSYDLRGLVHDLWIEQENPDTIILGMLVECSPRGSARPEQVARALGMAEPLSIHRRRLILGS